MIYLVNVKSLNIFIELLFPALIFLMFNQAISTLLGGSDIMGSDGNLGTITVGASSTDSLG
jgi:hypothetical protein